MQLGRGQKHTSRGNGNSRQHTYGKRQRGTRLTAGTRVGVGVASSGDDLGAAGGAGQALVGSGRTEGAAGARGSAARAPSLHTHAHATRESSAIRTREGKAQIRMERTATCAGIGLVLSTEGNEAERCKSALNPRNTVPE